MTITAVCVHVHVSDNRGTFCGAENSWLAVDIDNRKRCVTITAICVHVHMSDNRQTIIGKIGKRLSVDVGNRERLCGGKSGFRACSRER